MFDLHCHSLFSDGELLPSELVRRVELLDYKAIAITDHIDSSNFDFIIPRLVKVAKDINRYSSTKLIPGVELTHVHPDLIAPLTREARHLGANVLICHGETIMEPVCPGTNRAAIEAGIDILAHPGLISEEEVELAIQNGTFLELSGRKGHSFTNGHVARLAKTHGAKLIINSDAHAPEDFMSAERARKVGLGAGLRLEEVESIYDVAWSWVRSLI
ncbi:MAG: histidinol phosphate phosphatase domain-containing protein [Deltaproteobacteria bacterium]|nr:histidinol phosphate phosphatase domain-containing protein [Deltaproteobacteria bacterium]MDL1960880.1 histidinol phosphate phosphatase domain-containing protein [Deltaproteobacteria bacterium]